MPDNFTASMLERAMQQLPMPVEGLLPLHEWWGERGLDEDTIHGFARSTAQKHASSPHVLIEVGLMAGFELGKLASDPSFDLARELNK